MKDVNKTTTIISRREIEFDNFSEIVDFLDMNKQEPNPQGGIVERAVTCHAWSICYRQTFDESKKMFVPQNGSLRKSVVLVNDNMRYSVPFENYFDKNDKPDDIAFGTVFNIRDYVGIEEITLVKDDN